ncbi:hypothetical protein VZT92_011496 [Zoarces viviparus]|uniref:Uncharacterized protein n=1 Tax=Zoarces viviparus TaxID=48416 RepID=A0AAW1F5T9_ZOAVI
MVSSRLVSGLLPPVISIPGPLQKWSLAGGGGEKGKESSKGLSGGAGLGAEVHRGDEEESLAESCSELTNTLITFGKHLPQKLMS